MGGRAAKVEAVSGVSIHVGAKRADRRAPTWAWPYQGYFSAHFSVVVVVSQPHPLHMAILLSVSSPMAGSDGAVIDTDVTITRLFAAYIRRHRPVVRRQDVGVQYRVTVVP